MRCWFCGCNLIWSSDFTFEDYGLDGEGLVTVLSCSNTDCEATFEGYLKDSLEDN